MGMRPDLVIMLLAGRVNGPLTGMVIDRLTDGIADNRVDTLTEVCTTVLVDMVITLEGVVSISSGFDISIVVRVDAMARTVNGIVPDIVVSADVAPNTWAAVMSIFEVIKLPATLVDLFPCCCTAFSCWPITAVLCCRALQAWIPSRHVC